MNEPQERKSITLALAVTILVVLFVDDVVLWILGESREHLARGIQGVAFVAMAVAMFYFLETRTIARWLAFGWLALATLRFAQAFGIPRSELRLPFLLGFGLVGISALGYWLVARRRGSNRPPGGA